MTGVIFDLAQILIIIFFVLIDNGDIIINGESVEDLISLAFIIWTRIFFSLTQNLIQLAFISTIIMISR